MGCGFCESALSSSVGTLVVDCVVKPVGRQLGYVLRFHDNVEKLRKRKGELTMARDRLRHEIEDAERQHQRIEDDVRVLQSKADKFLTDMVTLEEEIQQNKRCLNWCPNWSWRYRLSKKAMKKTLAILELLEKINKFGQPGRVGYRATSTLPNIEFLCSEEFVFSKSANTAFNQIIKALKDDNISMIGLCGMGGVGKTTLVHEVGNQAQKSNLFDKVVIANVSKKPNFEAIQDDIAEYLGFGMKNERGIRRSVQELWQRLKNEKRILIILDDVWEDINLKKKIGIPLGEDHKGCKILLTARRQQVCSMMGCQIVSLGCLDDQEAWNLFAKKAGLIDSSEDGIKKLTNQIIKKCQGLPIAIVTLGSALKGKNPHGWEAAYWRLENRRLTEIEDVSEENAYLCLEASFDYLKDMETKICFLLCSLFPEDYEIYVEDLVRCAWGLELYKGIDSVDKVRIQVLAAVDALKNSYLLLDCGERHVKMHDTVREVALWIASSRKEMSFVINSAVETWPKDENFEHCTAISLESSQIAERPKGLVFPSLKILLLGGKYEHYMTTSNEFFEGMKALKVCALDRTLISLAAFQFQTNLRTLHLKNSKISDISILGKLKTLQVLSFNSSEMTELPSGIGELESLKLLELSDCGYLQRIPHSTLRLSNLEELYLDGCSSIKWATENATRKESYTSLSELNSLPKLAILSLDISLEQIPKGFVFCKLQSFDVCISMQRRRSNRKDFEICPISRSLKIERTVDACKQLFEDVESLNLTDVVGYQNLVPSLELDQKGFSKLTSLDLQSCKYMKCLIDTSKQQTSTAAFSNLVNLSLSDMLALEELCIGRQPDGFLQKLKTLRIYKCKEMICAIPVLQNLEVLIVGSCVEMQVLFQIAGLRSMQQGLNHAVSLQSLKVVEIASCNKLRYVFPMSVANSLGQLETLKIKSCLGLKEIIQATEVTEIQVLQELNRHLSFQSLKVVVICGCNHLRYLFPIFVARSLGQLENLRIESCLGLEEIIQATTVSDICLQSLKVVEIDSCNKLRYVFPMSVANSFGRLESLKIKRCLGLGEIIQATTTSVVSLQSLREVYVEECSNLTSLSSLAHGHRLKNLTKLGIYSCLQLEYTFPISMAEGLPELNVVHLVDLPQLKGRDGNDIVLSLRSLQKLKVHGCPQLIPFIISAEMQELQFGGLKERKQLRNMVVPELKGRSANMEYLTITNYEDLFDSGYNLSNMRMLRLEAIPELRVIWKGPVQVVNFQNLTDLEVYDCRRLRYIFLPTIASNLPQLSSLKISNCEELEQIIEKDQTSSQYHHHHLQPICFPNLTKISIFRCENLKCLFPITVADGGLPKLEAFDVSGASNLEQVFEEGNEANVRKDRQKRIQLPQLKFLWLGGLSNLVSFSPVGYHFCFPSMNWLMVKDCPNMTTSFSVDSQHSVNVKTEASQSVDEITVEESVRAYESAWPIGRDISWSYDGPRRD